MKLFGRNKLILAACLLFFFSVVFPFYQQADAATMQDYCVLPPFIAQSVPPLVMLEAGRDHKFYYEAYNDAFDLDEDGKLDRTYKHTIDYYGYFDPYKCYTYSSSGSGQFTPVSVTSDKFCSAGQWSGNVMNWLAMMRMDALKKVLYGGDRVIDTASTSTTTLGQTVLQRVVIPGDAHSVGKELTGRLCYNSSTSVYTYACVRDSDCDSGETCEDKSVNLLGIAAATAPHDCSVTAAITWTTQNATSGGKVRISRYRHDPALSSDWECGADTVTPNDPIVQHNNLMSSFEPETASNFIDTYLVNDFNDASLDPASDHYNNYNILAVADFRVGSTGSTTGTWQFLVDSDDPAEVEIGVAPATATGAYSGGSLVATYYGCHSKCFTGTPAGTATPCDANQRGSINLGSTGWYRLIVRQSDKTGQDGVKVWYKKPGATSWTIFPSGLQTTSTITRTPNVASGAECIIESNQYVQSGTPQLGVAGKQHLFCNTQLTAAGVPTLRMATNSQYRKWQWASKENPVCQGTVQQGTSDVAMDVAIADRTVRVEVCKSSVGLESNCKAYKDNSSPVITTYKPIGLLEKYGEGDGTKVCSKAYTKTCTTNSDCTIATEGFCIDKAPMYYGLMSSSYIKNTSGGVLRKNFNSLSDEINKYGSTTLLNGTFNTSATNGIINTFENFSGNVGYVFGNHNYDPSTSTTPTSTVEGSCGWITDGPLTEGKCREWGNPIGEMMYESLRYIAGAGSATTAFNVTTATDSGLSLPHPAWGYTIGSNTYQPYQVLPACARSFMLVLSDENTSFDDDQLPGSAFASVAADSALPNLNVSTLADVIGTGEGIAGHSWFIGKSGSTNDFICSSKAVTNLSSIEGLCPMEPTKRGSYYSAAVAYYAKTKLKDNTAKPNADTFVVALTSPLADLKIKAGSNFVSIVPFAKSVSGGASVRTNCYDRCTPASSTYTTAAGLRLGTCSSTAFCPTNQIVDLYVDDMRYDSSNNVIYASYRINFEDVEQGADHDMDTVVQYEVCTADAVTNDYGTCGTDTLSSGQIEVKVSNVYGKGGIDQVLGFVISGTSADGTYLVIKDGDVGNSSDSDTPALIAGMPLSWSNVFSTTGTSTELLKSPLWYAAKWGGFDDIDGDGKAYSGSSCGTATPDARCKEWDKDSDGTPDNYFLVANPLKLEEQLNKALLAILARASSGTAASVLASSEGRGANIIQALFHPKKTFENDTTVDWAGQLLNLWYYIDPKLQTNTIREDSVQDKVENLTTDWQIQFRFDLGLNKTVVDRYADTNGNGTPDAFQGTVEADAVRSLWEAGDKLFRRNLTSDPRTIKTTLLNTSPVVMTDFSTANAATLAPYLQAASTAEATNIIEYIQGIEKKFCTGTTTVCTSDANCGGAAGSCMKYRSRTVTSGGTTAVWKLGDIVTSTPKVQSPVNLNNYKTIYKDVTYSGFTESSNYKNYGTAYAGANDGMLHAFNFGVFHEAWSGQDKRFEPARITAASSDDFGKERWAFIPKNVLPYLKYLTKDDYCHIYSVDASPVIFDAAINAPTGCAGNYWDCDRKTTYQGSTTNLDLAQTSWRTVLIGSLRFGGACRGTTTVCTDVSGDGQKDCVNTPVDVTEGGTPKSIGYSSYFALDITDQDNPQLLWEFSNPALGYSTSGPAFMRIGARKPNPTDGGATTIPDVAKNGRWFVVVSSGPTGPVNTTKRQFEARSDQNLGLFILDLKTGQLVRTIDTGIQNAFGGSLLGGKMDYDLDYQDDVLYFGYTKKCSTTNNFCTANTWTDGGILRLVTKEDLSGNDAGITGNTAINPANWQWSTVMSGIGPVTASVTNLVKRSFSGLVTEGWLYYGTGRYFFRDDDTTNQRILFGIKEPCVSSSGFDSTCTSSRAFCSSPVNGASDPVTCGDLYNATVGVQLDPAAVMTLGVSGWYISMESPTNTNVPAGGITTTNITATAERVMTDPVAVPNGAVFFTTFAPNPDICAFGGNTFLWRLKYDTGSFIPVSGTALLQLSTGEIKELNMKTAFADKVAKVNSDPDASRVGQLEGPTAGRRTGAMVGVPPVGQGLSLVISPTPIDRIIHIQKK